MKRVEAESIGQILRRAIDESNMSARLDEWEAVKIWPVVIGEPLAAKMAKPFVKDGKMTVRVPSAPLRQELNMMRSSIAKAINETIGKDVIKNLEFR